MCCSTADISLPSTAAGGERTRRATAANRCRGSARGVAVAGRRAVVAVFDLVVVLAGRLGALAGLGALASARIGARRGLLGVPLARLLRSHFRLPRSCLRRR